MRSDDSGSISLYVVITFTALMAGFGLVVDVGRATVARGNSSTTRTLPRAPAQRPCPPKLS